MSKATKQLISEALFYTDDNHPIPADLAKELMEKLIIETLNVAWMEKKIVAIFKCGNNMLDKLEEELEDTRMNLTPEQEFLVEVLVDVSPKCKNLKLIRTKKDVIN